MRGFCCAGCGYNWRWRNGAGTRGKVTIMGISVMDRVFAEVDIGLKNEIIVARNAFAAYLLHFINPPILNLQP